jgi:hypothetical protein
LTISASQGRLLAKNNSSEQMLQSEKEDGDQEFLNEDMISRLFINQ